MLKRFFELFFIPDERIILSLQVCALEMEGRQQSSQSGEL